MNINLEEKVSDKLKKKLCTDHFSLDIVLDLLCLCYIFDMITHEIVQFLDRGLFPSLK